MEIKQIRTIISKGTMLPRKTFMVLSIILYVFILILIVIGIIYLDILVAILSMPFMLLAALTTFYAIRARARYVYAKKCLSDELIKLRAYAKSCGQQVGGDELGISYINRIHVEFMYEGKKHVLRSPIKKDGQIVGGFDNYVNKTIWIYYSPKYDDALITKKDWKYSKTKK